MGILEDIGAQIRIKRKELGYSQELLGPVVEADGLRLISPDDIAAMKICAIMNSGKRVKEYGKKVFAEIPGLQHDFRPEIIDLFR